MANASSPGGNASNVVIYDMNRSSTSERESSSLRRNTRSQFPLTRCRHEAFVVHPNYNDERNRILEDIGIDGVTNAAEKDAPGQSCVYIPPGNHERQEYRTATFANFPPDVPVIPVALAKAGFYYTGFKDRVKCFSCGMAVDNWVIGDDVFLPRWHKENCLMPRGGDPRNVPSISEYPTLFKGLLQQERNSRDDRLQTQSTTPVSPDLQFSDQQFGDVTTRLRNVNITVNENVPFRFANIVDPTHERELRTLNLRREKDRRKTYTKWPSYPAPLLASDLAKYGLFYLGNLDRTQCFSCGGVLRNWLAGDDVASQHREHFPECRLNSNVAATGNIPMTEQERNSADAADRARLRQIVLTDEDPIVEPPDPIPEEQQRLSRLYQLNNAANSAMASFQQRLDSFARGWPGQTRATPEHIAKAGFYFLGESDKTKCYYCNGGLQNWDRNDEPWTEHAKWFPGCAFVIRRKGQEFVKRLYEAHPNLNRPMIRNPVSYNQPYDIPPQDERLPAHTAQPINLDALRDMGFPTERIQRMIRRKTSENGRGYANVQDLIDDLLQEDDSSEQQQNTSSMHEAGEHTPPPIQGRPQIVVAAAAGQKRYGQQGSRLEDVKKTRTQSPSTTTESTELREMEESLRSMQESDRCKNCRMNAADVVCIPCGHLAACSDCARNMTRCFICNSRVHSQMKVYRA